MTIPPIPNCEYFKDLHEPDGWLFKIWDKDDEAFNIGMDFLFSEGCVPSLIKWRFIVCAVAYAACSIEAEKLKNDLAGASAEQWRQFDDATKNAAAWLAMMKGE